MEKTALKGIFAKGAIPAGADYKVALTDILHTFPYFQLAQILLAKQMYDSHEPEAPGRIKLASVYAPDRKVMYHLFKTTDDTRVSVPVADAPAKLIEKPGGTGVKYNYVYTSSATTKNTEVNHPQQKIEVKPAEASKKEEPAHTEIFIRKESENKLPLIPPVEKTMRVTLPKTELPKPESKKTDTPTPVPARETMLPVPEKKNEKQAPATGIQPGSSLKKEEKKDVKAIDSEDIKPVKDNTVEGKNIKDEIPPVSSSSNEPLSNNNLKYSFSSWLKVVPEISIAPKEPENTVAQQKKSDIIDSFLSKLPSISRPKTEFFSPVKAAKMSITEDATIVSETLAKIYFEQGNLQKALNAYQTLLTKFPEKKNIFAPRIEKIKTLMRENTKPATK